MPIVEIVDRKHHDFGDVVIRPSSQRLRRRFVVDFKRKQVSIPKMDHLTKDQALEVIECLRVANDLLQGNLTIRNY